MQKLQFREMTVGGLLFVLIIVIALSSCMSSQRTSQGNTANTAGSAFNKLELKEQKLNGEELADIALWKSTELAIFTQNHLEPTDDNLPRIYNPWIASYEGFRMASLLGLDSDFSTDEIYLFIRALFDDMPTDVETGSLVKSIVVSDWYDDGSPLVINVTRAYSGNKNPIVVFMFNTWNNLRKYGLPLIKKAGIVYEYPRLKTPEGEFLQEFMDSYSMSWLEDGFMTASGAVGKDLPLFSSVDDDFEKLNLTDDWLRDGNLDNDAEVLPVLTEIITRDEIKPIGKVFARMQLFMYHLFHGEVELAQAVINELNESGILEQSEVSETEVGILAKRDLQRILDIAVMLSNQ
ncbi:MAG: hypothetical protein JEZ04_17715 [Spirochaetales bacterium]|nr:hypothetical protein [Spirochaetales bacterium]